MLQINKHIVFSLLVVSSLNIVASVGRLVTFPTKQVLLESLLEAGFDHFVEKTHIENIAEKRLVVDDVCVKLNLALYDYNEDLKAGGQNARQAAMMARIMHMRKPQLLEILLQNDPQALVEAQRIFAEVE